MLTGISIYQMAKAYHETKDEFRDARLTLIEAVSGGAESWNGKCLLAKAIEDMIDAKISAALKQHEEAGK